MIETKKVYARFEQLHGNNQEAREFLKRADDVKAFLNRVWWDNESGTYYSSLGLDRKLKKTGSNLAVLYYGVAEEGAKAESVVNAILRSIESKESIGIEQQSHLPEILYRYGRPEAAYAQILDLTREEKKRREYPEVSYSVIGAIVTGTMGTELALPESLNGLQEALYVQRTVRTLPRLTAKTKWAELRHVPIWTNEISVRHDGLNKTTLTNVAGPALIWNACFPGVYSQLLANGKGVEAMPPGATRNGQPVSCTTIVVGSGERKVVQTTH